MKIIFPLFLILISYSIIKAQHNILSTYTKIYIDSTEHIAQDEYLNNPIYFQKQFLNKEKKKELTNAIIKFSTDTTNYTLGNLYFTNELIIDSSFNNTIDSKKYYTLSNSNLDDYLINDTLITASQIPLIDKDGEYVYDELGDQLLKTINVSYHLKEVLLAINQLEYWEYENNIFSKNTILNNVEYKTPVYSSHFNWKRSLLNFKANQSPATLVIEPLLKNIKYHYYFFDINRITKPKNYWKKKEELQNQVAILANKSYRLRQTHLSQYHNLSASIIEDIFNHKLPIVDTNNKHISSSNIKNLFNYETNVHLTDENDDLVYDELGDQIFIGLSSFYEIEDIVGITFNENWYLATNQFDIVKKVNSISFIGMYYDAFDNEYKIQELPFKVLFN